MGFKNVKNITMKKIIVPTDFSYAAKDAFDYALSIASVMDTDIEIVHIHDGLLNANKQYSIHLGLGIRDSLMKDLVEFTKLGVDEEVITKTKVNISYKVIGGLVSNQLIKLSKSEDTLMIVMGKTGKRVSINRLFGSVAREVSTKSFCPVLLVPQGKDYTVIDNILYASDYGAIDQFTLQKVVDFGERFKSAMHFVHVTDSKLDTNYKVIEEKIFDFLFQDNDPTFSFNLVNIKYPDVVTGLNKYIEENKIDLLIMVSHHRNFLSKLFFKSTTKEMAYYSNVPMLVYHKE